MNLRLASDIHNEFEPWNLKITPEDKNRILVLAGDIHPRAGSAEWLAHASKHFKEIVLVLGNHDYWKDSLENASKRLKTRLESMNIANVHVLDRDTHETTLDGKPVRFLGCTLWTDYNGADNLTMWDANQTIKDFKKIRTHAGTRHLSTWDVLQSHQKDKKFLEEQLAIPFDGHTIVVTHHAPSIQSIPLEFQDPKHYHGNGAYVSNLNEWVLDKAFDIWLHGHTHNSMDYPFGTGRVICNPRGYAPSDLNDEFQEEFIVDLSLIIPAKQQSHVDYGSWWSTNLG